MATPACKCESDSWLQAGLAWLDSYDRGLCDIGLDSTPETPAFLSVEDIIDLQKQLLGGQFGLRDANALASALTRAHNAIAYDNANFEQAGWLIAEGIVKNHPFTNGNKRTALLALVEFWRRNNVPVPQDAIWLAQKIVHLARGM